MEVVSVQHSTASFRSYLPNTCAFVSISTLECSPNISSRMHTEQLIHHLSSRFWAPMDTHFSLKLNQLVGGKVAIGLSLHKYVSHHRKPLQTCHE